MGLAYGCRLDTLILMRRLQQAGERGGGTCSGERLRRIRKERPQYLSCVSRWLLTSCSIKRLQFHVKLQRYTKTFAGLMFQVGHGALLLTSELPRFHAN
jgi:hypothetical protein